MGKMDRNVFRAFILTVLIASLFLPTAAWSLEPEVLSRTYLSVRETFDGDTAAPVYEYLDLDVVNIGGESVELHTGGWARWDLGDDWSGEDSESELNYGYVRFKFKNTARLDAGRIFANEGFIAEQVDGGRISAESPVGLGLSIFGGDPVENDTGDLEADALYGGRVHYRWKNNLVLGASYLTQDGESEDTDREEAGWDIWLMPVSAVQIHGLSSYNYETEGWMEHSYLLFLRPHDLVMISGEYSKIDYEHFFTNSTLSVFDLTSLNQKEKLQTVGGSVDLFVTNTLTAIGQYKKYSYDEQEDAEFYGGELAYSSSPYTAGASVHRMEGDTDDMQYTQYRAYASRSWSRAVVAVDYVNVDYDEDIFGTSNAFAVSGAATYNVLQNLQIGADVEYGENPFFDETTEGFLKIIYHFKPSGGA